MSKDLNIADLESTNVEAPAAKKEKKVQTVEERATLDAAIEKVREFGVSDKFDKVLPLIAEWNGESDMLKMVKEETIAHFGGSEAFKTYIETEFADELAVIAGIQKVVTTGNNVKSFYARRSGSGSTKKVKTIQVNLAGVPHLVSSEYYETLAGKSADEKRELLLAHPATTKMAAIEEL